MVRAITFDGFGTIIDTGRDVLIRIARAVCDDHQLALDPEALLATWDRYFFGPEGETFLTLEEITEGSLGKAFHEHGIEGDPRPYVDHLVSLWRQAKAYAEVPAVLAALDGIPRAVRSHADHEFLIRILQRNGLRFDAVITSESARTYKPRPRIFEAALESLRVRPRDVVHVGDSLHADIGGASPPRLRALGGDPANVRPRPRDPRPDAGATDPPAPPQIIARIPQPPPPAP